MREKKKKKKQTRRARKKTSAPANPGSTVYSCLLRVSMPNMKTVCAYLFEGKNLPSAGVALAIRAWTRLETTGRPSAPLIYPIPRGAPRGTSSTRSAERTLPHPMASFTMSGVAAPALTSKYSMGRSKSALKSASRARTLYPGLLPKAHSTISSLETTASDLARPPPHPHLSRISGPPRRAPSVLSHTI